MTHPQFLKLLSDHRNSLPSKNKKSPRACLSITEQAKILGVSHASLYNWMEKAPGEIVMLGVEAKIQQRKSKGEYPLMTRNISTPAK